MTKRKALFLNIGRGAILFGAIGAFLGVGIGRITRPLHVPLLDDVLRLEVASGIGIVVGGILGAVFGLLPDKKWNPVKKVKSDSLNESR